MWNQALLRQHAAPAQPVRRGRNGSAATPRRHRGSAAVARAVVGQVETRDGALAVRLERASDLLDALVTELVVEKRERRDGAIRAQRLGNCR